MCWNSVGWQHNVESLWILEIIGIPQFLIGHSSGILSDRKNWSLLSVFFVLFMRANAQPQSLTSERGWDDKAFQLFPGIMDKHGLPSWGGVMTKFGNFQMIQTLACLISQNLSEWYVQKGMTSLGNIQILKLWFQDFPNPKICSDSVFRMICMTSFRNTWILNKWFWNILTPKTCPN
jgi:hypothetical protein